MSLLDWVAFLDMSNVSALCTSCLYYSHSRGCIAACHASAAMGVETIVLMKRRWAGRSAAFWLLAVRRRRSQLASASRVAVNKIAKDVFRGFSRELVRKA